MSAISLNESFKYGIIIDYASLKKNKMKNAC